MLRYENRAWDRADRSWARCARSRHDDPAGPCRRAHGAPRAAIVRHAGARLHAGLVGLLAALLLTTGIVQPQPARAQAPAAPQAASASQESPEAMIERVGNEILRRFRADASLRKGDIEELSALVDELVMPHVDFERITRLAAGRWWRQATPEQRERLMQEFRAMLLRTYSGALEQVGDQSIRMKPARGPDDATDRIVRSEIVQPGREPIQLDYRMYKTDSGWKIYDLNVLGVWIVETYRNQFNQQAQQGGVEGLIRSLADRNRESGPQQRS